MVLLRFATFYLKKSKKFVNPMVWRCRVFFFYDMFVVVHFPALLCCFVIFWSLLDIQAILFDETFVNFR